MNQRRVVMPNGFRKKSSLKTLLAGKLKSWELKLTSESYDIIGDIAVIKLPEPFKVALQRIVREVSPNRFQVAMDIVANR